MATQHVAVIGSGSWGTTLALILAGKGWRTLLYCRTPEEAATLEAERQNHRFLPDATFPPSLHTTTDYAEALGDDCALCVVAVPSHTLRVNIAAMRPFLHPHTIIVCATKGLESLTFLRMTEVIDQEIPEGRICALSGPNIAKEIANGKPSTTVVAGTNTETCAAAQTILMSTMFRVYTNADVIGVELGGALKNIIALGAGICDGLEAGDNAKAAFMTRGIAEVGRLGAAAGANPLTFLGLAGLGDMVATCASPHSRNRFVGQELAKGRTLKEILTGMTQVAEGVTTTAVARGLAQRYAVEMPITEQLYQVMFENKPFLEAVRDLMMRDATAELHGFDL